MIRRRAAAARCARLSAADSRFARASASISARPDRSRASASARSRSASSNAPCASSFAASAQPGDDGIGVGKTIQSVAQVAEFGRLRGQFPLDLGAVVGFRRFAHRGENRPQGIERYARALREPSQNFVDLPFLPGGARLRGPVLGEEIENVRGEDLFRQIVRAREFERVLLGLPQPREMRLLGRP